MPLARSRVQLIGNVVALSELMQMAKPLATEEPHPGWPQTVPAGPNDVWRADYRR